MTRWAALSAGAILFLLAATANAGGYRYGVSDQAFYVPVIAQTLDPALFPRGSDIFGPQARLWPGRHLFAGVARVLSIDIPTLFALAYGLTLLVLYAGAIGLSRGLGFGWPAVSAFLALLTLRHQIAKTGANSLEAYMHPRMLAFAAGLAALAFLLHRRNAAAIVTVLAAGIVHPTTAVWFAIVLAIAFTATLPSRTRVAVAIGLAVCGAGVIASTLLFKPGPIVMDAAWRDLIRDRDYLFPSEWPLSSWVLNLLYPLAIGAIYRRRRLSGTATPVESALVAGLLVLVAAFFASVPLSALGVTAVVQAQVPRVFWVLDAVALAYLAWWLIDRATARRRTWPAILAGVLIATSATRGFYILRIEARRPLARITLPAGDWTDAMNWLRTQPTTWFVLADLGHAWLYGSSIRVAALRDTLYDASKDPAMALYDRDVALRVAERARAVGDGILPDRLGAIDERYHLDVLVVDSRTPFDRPVLYRNASFVVYDLR